MSNLSIKEIAKLSGVSVATVSRVINNNGRFSEKTRKKVLQIIEETGYQTNFSAKSLRMNKSFSIGVLVPDISNYFFSDVVQRIEEILFESGYSTIICNTARSLTKESAYLKMLKSKMIDGLIVISGADEFGFDSENLQKKIPYICIDREPKNRDNTVFISSNHYEGAFEATQELIDSGSKHLAIVMHTRTSPSSRERLKGFQEALKENSLSFNNQNHLIQVDFKKENWQAEVASFLAENPLLDGLFAVNDTIAVELLDLLPKFNKVVPNDIRIIGFDNTPLSEHSYPKLSSIKQDTEKIAKLAVESLLKLLNKEIENLNYYQLVPVELIRRDTSLNPLKK